MQDSPLDFDMRGFIENSLLEWENRISAVVIAGGCNLRCPYCHSWRYVTGVQDLEKLDPKVVFELLDRQKDWIDGVVFSGGEATLQPDLAKFMERVKSFGVATKLHTNGTRPEVIQKLVDRNLVDSLALDYKAPLDKRFFNAAGIPENTEILERIKQTFRLAAGPGADAGVEREYHTTLVPLLITPETIAEMAADLEPGGVWFLQQFENDDCLDENRRNATRYNDEQLDEIESIARATRHGKVILKRGK